MLIEFSVANYRSFKEKVTFSMVSADLDGSDENLKENNIFAVDEELSLVKCAAIYGANASGKSNIAKALNFMKKFIINSSKETQSTDSIPVEPFRLSTETENQPSFFELVFLLDGKIYRYGFEADRDKIVSEWLFYVPKTKETNLFNRNTQHIKASKKYKADIIVQQKLTRNNALFLSVSAQFNVEIAEKILKFLDGNISMISGLRDDGYRHHTISCLIEQENAKDILELVKRLDVGITGLKIEQIPITSDMLPDSMHEEVKVFILKNVDHATTTQTIHKKFDQEGNFHTNEEFDIDEQESEGTQKLFAIAGVLVTTLKQGKVLIVDEFDARLHPLMSRAIVGLFNSKETNPRNAQLIFMTHDTNLLSPKIFRRDQIWFTEKNRYGATDLYSLAEYQIPENASFENDYIEGRYGAIPYIGNFKTWMTNSTSGGN
ncbi:MAG: AAA family ATPase [Prochlorotrichaceae cyanobacterium]